MKAKTISHCQGKGSLAHNNRTFKPKNVDSSRTSRNITFVKIPIAEAYDKCFAEAVERYNKKQKRADRRIKDGYFRYVFSHAPCNNVIEAADKRKSFYEDIVQIGDRNDTGIGSADAETAAECLTEYMQGFQKRNPNFFVFNAVLHLDEATPHIHIDYIPIGHYKRGVDTQNGLAQALKEMGYGEGENAISRWRTAEYNVLAEICRHHRIEISEPQKSRGYSYTVDEYKQYKDTIAKLERQTNELKTHYNKLVNMCKTAKSEATKANEESEKAKREFRRLQSENALRSRVANLNNSMIHQMVLLNDEICAKKLSAVEAEKDRLKSEYDYFLKMKEDFRKYAQKYINEIQDEQKRKAKMAELEKQLFSFDGDNESLDDYVNRITQKNKQKQRSL